MTASIRRRAYALAIVFALQYSLVSVHAMSFGATVSPYIPDESGTQSSSSTRFVSTPPMPHSGSNASLLVAISLGPAPQSSSALRFQVYDPVSRSFGGSGKASPLSNPDLGSVLMILDPAYENPLTAWTYGVMIMTSHFALPAPAIEIHRFNLHTLAFSAAAMTISGLAAYLPQLIVVSVFSFNRTHVLAAADGSDDASGGTDDEPLPVWFLTIPTLEQLTAAEIDSTAIVDWTVTTIPVSGSLPAVSNSAFAYDRASNRLFRSGGITGDSTRLDALCILEVLTALWSCPVHTPNVHYEHGMTIAPGGQLIIVGGACGRVPGVFDSKDNFNRIDMCDITRALPVCFGSDLADTLSVDPSSTLRPFAALSTHDNGFQLATIAAVPEARPEFVTIPLPLQINPASGNLTFAYTKFAPGAVPKTCDNANRIYLVLPLSSPANFTTRVLAIGTTNDCDAFNGVSYSFDLTNMSWSNPILFTGPDTLPVPLTGHTAVLTPDERTIVVYGGRNGSYPPVYSDVWRIRVSDWSVVKLPAPGLGRVFHTATLLPDARSMLVIGGCPSDGFGVVCALNYSVLPVFDVVTSTWSVMSCVVPDSIPVEYLADRSGHAAHLIDTRVFVVGGQRTSPQILVLDTVTATWSYVPEPAGAAIPKLLTSEVASAAIGLKIVCLSAGPNLEFWVFDSTSSSWGSYSDFFSFPSDLGLQFVSDGSGRVWAFGDTVDVLNTGLRNVRFARPPPAGTAVHFDAANRTPNNLGCIATNGGSIPCEQLSVVYPHFSIPYPTKFTPLDSGSFVHAGVSMEYSIAGFGADPYPLTRFDSSLLSFNFPVPFVLSGYRFGDDASQRVRIDCNGIASVSPGSKACLYVLTDGAPDATQFSKFGVINSNQMSIYVDVKQTGRAILTGLSFSNCSGLAVVVSQYNTVTINACSFDGITTATAVSVTRFSVITITDSTFHNCWSGLQGVSAAVTIAGSTFTKCGNSHVDGGAIQLSSSELTLVNCTFVWNSAGGNGGAIAMFANSQLEVKAISLFAFNSAGSDGGAVYLTTSASALGDATFIENTAGGSGGAVSIDTNSQLSIFNAEFRGNRAFATEATRGGGAVYCGLDTGGLSWISLVNSESVYFNNNSASLSGGGAIFHTHTARLEHTYSAENVAAIAAANTALYGSAFATDLTRLVFANTSASAVSQISGEILSPPIVISSFDAYNQTILNDQSTTIVISPFEAFNGANIALAVNGVCTFARVVVALQPGATATDVKFASTTGLTLPHALSIRVAECTAGQYEARVSGGSNAESISYACTDCAAGAWSSGGNVTSCLLCPAGTAKQLPGVGTCAACDGNAVASAAGTVRCRVCENGFAAWAAINDCVGCSDENGGLECANGYVSIRPDFWLPVDSTYDIAQSRLNAFPCPFDHCMGSAGVSVSRETIQAGTSNVCSPNRVSGDQNPLCARCVAGHSEWINQCLACDDARPNGGVIFFALLVNAGVAFAVYHLSQDTADPSVGTFLYFIATFRLLIGTQRTYLTWLGLFDFSPLSIPNVCPFSITPLQSLVLSIVAPLTYLVWLALAACVHAVWSRFPRAFAGCCAGGYVLADVNQFRVRRYMRAVITTLISSYTALTAAVFAALDCTAYPNVRVVFTFPAVECSDPAYRAFLPFAYFMIIAFSAGVPIGMAAIVWAARKRRKQLPSHARTDATASRDGAAAEADSTLFWFSSVYAVYESTYEWWSVLAVLRRTVILAVGLEFSQSPFDRQRIFVLLCLLYFVAQMTLAPLRTSSANRFESGTLFALVVVGVLAQTQSDGAQLSVFAQVCTTLALFVVGCVFVKIKVIPLLRPRVMRVYAACCGPVQHPAGPIADPSTSPPTALNSVRASAGGDESSLHDEISLHVVEPVRASYATESSSAEYSKLDA